MAETIRPAPPAHHRASPVIDLVAASGNRSRAFGRHAHRRFYAHGVTVRGCSYQPPPSRPSRRLNPAHRTRDLASIQRTVSTTVLIATVAGIEVRSLPCAAFSAHLLLVRGAPLCGSMN
jgi:hypothetical protein